MTLENFEEAIRLKKEIKKTEHMVESLQNGYVNFVRSVAYAGGNEDDAVTNFSSGDELHELILSHFKSKLIDLEKQFDQM